MFNSFRKRCWYNRLRRSVLSLVFVLSLPFCSLSQKASSEACEACLESEELQSCIACERYIMRHLDEMEGETGYPATNWMNFVAMVYYNANDFIRCRNLEEAIVDQTRIRFGAQDSTYATSLNNLAKTCYYLGDYVQAKKLFSECLLLRENIHGKEHPDYAFSLNCLADTYSQLGDYAQELELRLNSLPLHEKIYGKEHEGYVNTLNSLAGTYEDLGEYNRALDLGLECLVIREKTLGTQHPDYAQSLNNVATVYMRIGEYAKALELQLECIGIIGEVFSIEHPNYALVLSNLSSTYGLLGDYDQALKLNLESLDLREKIYGKEHPDYASSLNNLSEIYSELGDYAQALKLNLECLHLFEKIYGKEHPNYALSLNNLASTYSSLGDYDQAVELSLECVSLREKTCGKEHPDYASSLSDLACYYSDLGDYARALEISSECLLLREKNLGKEHPDYTISLNILSLTYSKFGNFNKALELQKQSVDLREKIHGKEHPDYAVSLNNLAQIYSDLGDYAQALKLNLECLNLFEKIYGKEHPKYALSLNNLAGTYSFFGDNALALNMNIESLDLREKIHGKEHPDYARSLNNLAVTYSDLGDYAQALELNLECLSLYEKLLGKEHPDYARSLNNLALTYSSIADFNSAYDAIMQWLEWSSGRLIANESNLNTGLREEHYAAHLEGLQMAMQIAQLADKPFPYAYWLSARSRDLGTAQILSRAVASSEDAELIAVLDEMRRINSQLSQLEEQVYEKPQLRAFMDELQTQSALLERRLMQESAVYAALQKQISVADLAGVLNAGEVFVDIMPLEPSQVDSTYSYVAFVLSSGDTVPEIVELGPGGFLDSKYSVYSSYTQDLRDPEVFGGACFDIYWEPLLSSLGDADRVYYCPDGVYAKMNPGVFYDPNKSSYVLDELDIRLVSSGTDLVRQREGFYELLSAGEDASLSALLLGDPKFDLEEGWRSGNESLAFERDIRAVLNDTLTRGTSISRLPGTRTEVEGLSATLKSGGYQVETLMDKRASEARLKQADLVDVLHLATHGYFLENVKREFDEFGMQQGGRSQAVQENPMHRSGLLLAGAENTRRGEDISGTENGWFSAQEASGLNLLGTDLVVMSACETGKGDIQNGRGVFGLQRAMRAAGAESVVMSLWSVDDDATSALMQSFYGHWLNGLSTPDALKMAQDDLRQKRPHPYYWGAWVCTGE